MGTNLIGELVILNGRRETIIDSGEERIDDKGYRIIRVEFASGGLFDLLAPVQTLESMP